MIKRIVKRRDKASLYNHLEISKFLKDFQIKKMKSGLLSLLLWLLILLSLFLYIITVKLQL